MKNYEYPPTPAEKIGIRMTDDGLSPLPAWSCSALSDFIAALKKGKLQHCTHDEWNDCDLEKITIGYLLRAREFRIIEQNAES